MQKPTSELMRDPRPQWAPGAAEHLESLICPTTEVTTVFEWGGGFSTPWLLKRLHADMGIVITVESSLEWLKKIWDMTRDYDNHFLLYAEAMSDRYVRYSSMTDPIPGNRVFIVDGYQRLRCVKMLLTRLYREGDIMVFDDAQDYIKDMEGRPVTKFKMPHPMAGKPVTHDKWGNHLHKVGGPHPEFKETWVVV